MAGIYIHIPFCKRKCHYCNFHIVTSLRYQDEMIAAILREAELQKDYLGWERVETIYFGGGTPSLLQPEALISIFEKLHQLFTISASAEVTLEANPDDISEEKLRGWILTGINRLSIGVQSFVDEELRWMNRVHSAKQAMISLEKAMKYFNNISVDLIYGTPGLRDEKWKQNVEIVISWGIPHISCYALTVEPNTPLHKMIRQQKSPDVNSGHQSNQFLMLMQWMEDAGYEHYEISNFAKPGWRSRHNTSYWLGEKYLGLGPSAHSFNFTSRQWNIAHNDRYIKSIQSGKIPFEMEILTPTQQLNEYIMISLRRKEGMNLEVLKQRFGISEKEIMGKVEKYIYRKLLTIENNTLVLTREGKLLADGIAADLFY